MSLLFYLLSDAFLPRLQGSWPCTALVLPNWSKMLKKVSHDPNHFTTIWHYHMISWVISCHIYLQMIWPYIDSTAAKFFGLINGSYHLPHLKLHRKNRKKPVHLRHLSPFFFHQVWHQSFLGKINITFLKSSWIDQLPSNTHKQYETANDHALLMSMRDFWKRPCPTGTPNNRTWFWLQGFPARVGHKLQFFPR